METPETIRLSLETGEWITSLDFSDAYFHIPIAQRSRKYLRFFLFNQTFQFTALPFGLATAPVEFTKVVKEVKLMAQARGIRIHQYLDDWLLRAPSPEICLQHTQTLLALCKQLGWVVNMTKSELVPKQVFNFVGYRFVLITGRVLPTQDRWEALQVKVRFIKGRHNCTVRQFMSLIGLLTATEKQVCSGRLHMRPDPTAWAVDALSLRWDQLEAYAFPPVSLIPQVMEADLRSESSQFIPQHRHFQNGDSRDNPVVLGNRGVDHIAGLQRRILPHSHCPKVKKVSQVLPVQSNLSVHSSSLRVGHSSRRVHQGGQRSETHGSSTGYQNPPVPRRLVTESPFPGDLPTTYPDPLGPV